MNFNGFYPSMIILRSILISLMDATLLFRYRKALNDRFHDHNMPNTGGEWLFLATMFGFNFNQHLALNITFEIPLYTKVVGTQLSPTYRLNAGVFIKINKKNELKKIKRIISLKIMCFRLSSFSSYMHAIPKFVG